MKHKIKVVSLITFLTIVLSTIFSSNIIASSAPGIISGQTYWIVNAHSGKVLDVDSNNNVIQWKNNNGNNQKWKVVYYSSGDYYTISPVNKSEYFLSTSSATLSNGTNVCVKKSSSSNVAKWSITNKKPNCNYIIRSKININYALTTFNAGLTDGSNIIAYTYSNNDNCNDEWIFVNTAGNSVNSVTIAVQQDKSYRERFSQMPSEINKVIADVAKPFYSRWHIEFRPSYYNLTSMKMDACPRGYSNECIPDYCGSICVNRNTTPNHHKNFDYNALNAWNNYGRDGNSIRLIAVGADLCHEANGKHSVGALGMTSANRTDCMTEQNRGHMLNVRVIQHELSHVFGDGHCGTTNTPCIMSGGFDNNYSYNINSIWCPECIKKFKRTSH